MNILDWLLDSDSSIRWQVMRDLVGEPEMTVSRERSRVRAVASRVAAADRARPLPRFGGHNQMPAHATCVGASYLRYDTYVCRKSSRRVWTKRR